MISYVQENQLYKFSKFLVRPAPRNKQVKDTYFEIELRPISEVIPLEDIPDFAPLKEEVFTDIAKIKLLPDETTICKTTL